MGIGALPSVPPQMRKGTEFGEGKKLVRKDRKEIREGHGLHGRTRINTDFLMLFPCNSYHLNISGKLLLKVVSTLKGRRALRRRDSTAAYSTTDY